MAEVIFGHEIYLSCPECGKKGSDSLNGGERATRIHDPECSKFGQKPKKAKVRYIGEQHVLEDFGSKFIPTASDYLEHMDIAPWMNNGVDRNSVPTSHIKLAKKPEKTIRRTFTLD